MRSFRFRCTLLRKRERGYNQAELIARQVSEKTGIPYVENCLIRQKNTKRQSEMSQYAERLQNVSHAFLCTHPESLAGKRILLLDDILTSGETIVRCSHGDQRGGRKAKKAIINTGPASAPESGGNSAGDFRHPGNDIHCLPYHRNRACFQPKIKNARWYKIRLTFQDHKS